MVLLENMKKVLTGKSYLNGQHAQSLVAVENKPSNKNVPHPSQVLSLAVDLKS